MYRGLPCWLLFADCVVIGESLAWYAKDGVVRMGYECAVCLGKFT